MEESGGAERVDNGEKTELATFEQTSSTIARYVRRSLYRLKNIEQKNAAKVKDYQGVAEVNPYDPESVTRFINDNWMTARTSEIMSRLSYVCVRRYAEVIQAAPQRFGNIVTHLRRDGSFVVNPDLTDAQQAVLPDQSIFTEPLPELEDDYSERHKRNLNAAMGAQGLATATGGMGSFLGSRELFSDNDTVSVGVIAGTVAPYALTALTQYGHVTNRVKKYMDSVQEVTEVVTDPEKGALVIPHLDDIMIELDEEYGEYIEKVFPNYEKIMVVTNEKHANGEPVERRAIVEYGRLGGYLTTTYKISPAYAVGLAIKLDPDLMQSWSDGMDNSVLQIQDNAKELSDAREALIILGKREKHTGVKDATSRTEIENGIAEARKAVIIGVYEVLQRAVQRYKEATLLDMPESKERRAIIDIAFAIAKIPEVERKHLFTDELRVFRGLVATTVNKLGDADVGIAHSMHQYVDGTHEVLDTTGERAQYTKTAQMANIYQGFLEKYEKHVDAEMVRSEAFKLGIELPEPTDDETDQ